MRLGVENRTPLDIPDSRNRGRWIRDVLEYDDGQAPRIIHYGLVLPNKPPDRLCEVIDWTKPRHVIATWQFDEHGISNTVSKVPPVMNGNRRVMAALDDKGWDTHQFQ
jgi:hypothetical protein